MLPICAGIGASAAAFGLYALVDWPWWLLGWVGWVPFLAAVERLKTWKRAVYAGLAMSVAYVVAVFWWFAVGIADYTGIGVPVASLVLAALAPVLQPQLLALALIWYATRRSACWWLRSLVVASSYCGAEWALPRLFGDTIGHGLYASPLLRQAADVGGAAGLTFILVLSNQWLIESLRRLRAGNPQRAFTPMLSLAAVVGSMVAYGFWRLDHLKSPAAEKTILAAAVQGGISHYTRMATEIGTYESTRRILDAYFELSLAALDGGEVDLIVWPETAYPTTFGAPKSADGAAFDKEIAAFVVRSRVPLVFGAYDTDGEVEHNAAFFVEPRGDGEGVTFDTYLKGALFPLTERVPWFFDNDVVRGWMPWLGTWTPGNSARVIELGLPSGRRLRVAPLICYDAVDSDRGLEAARQGAEIIVTLSNDSWFARGSGPRLHLVVSAFRSLETRLAQVRVTNTGISAFITPAGDIIAGAGVGERTAVVARLPIRRAQPTLMLLWGNWSGPAALVLALALSTCFAPGAGPRLSSLSCRHQPTVPRRPRRSSAVLPVPGRVQGSGSGTSGRSLLTPAAHAW